MSTDQSKEPTFLAETAVVPTIPGMSPAMSIWFDDRLFDRAKLIAKYLSEAEGFVPTHLLGKTAACFAVVERSLTWRLSPYAVAQSTYQTPGGKVGYEGKLCQAILENSGKVEGSVKYTHYGDWAKVKGKFQIKRSEKGKEYPVATWTREDAKGLGVTVSAKVVGETEPRTLDYDLDEAFPLNSTLWATKPQQQICYTAVRAFANLCAPGLFMGVPFDREDQPVHAGNLTPDVDGVYTPAGGNAPPRPSRSDFVDNRPSPSETHKGEPYTLLTADGEEMSVLDPEAYVAAVVLAFREAAKLGLPQLEGIWEGSSACWQRLPEGLADQIRSTYDILYKEATARPAKTVETKDEPKQETVAEPAKADVLQQDTANQEITLIPVTLTDKGQPNWQEWSGKFEIAVYAQPKGLPRGHFLNAHQATLDNFKMAMPQPYLRMIKRIAAAD